jgi:hypothetical protein
MTYVATFPGGPTRDCRSVEKTSPQTGASNADRKPGEPDDEIQPTQVAMDLIDEAGMESFPCSDPPSYVRCHA